MTKPKLAYCLLKIYIGSKRYKHQSQSNTYEKTDWTRMRDFSISIQCVFEIISRCLDEFETSSRKFNGISIGQVDEIIYLSTQRFPKNWLRAKKGTCALYEFDEYTKDLMIYLPIRILISISSFFFYSVDSQKSMVLLC